MTPYHKRSVCLQRQDKVYMEAFTVHPDCIFSKYNEKILLIHPPSNLTWQLNSNLAGLNLYKQESGV